MDKDRGLSMNNDEQGLQTRLAAHARAQAQAGSGNLGAVKRALNNGIAAGTGNLTKAQRGIATARGQKANEILAKNSGPIEDQLGAALLKGPSAIHMKSAAVDETRRRTPTSKLELAPILGGCLYSGELTVLSQVWRVSLDQFCQRDLVME